eukprot:scpid7958/ scgid23580/ 
MLAQYEDFSRCANSWDWRVDILKEEYSKLVMIIHPEVDILDRLYETDIIPIRLRELIESNGKEERSSEDQAKRLLRELPRLGPQAFNQFYRAVKSSTLDAHKHAAKFLENKLQIKADRMAAEKRQGAGLRERKYRSHYQPVRRAAPSQAAQSSTKSMTEVHNDMVVEKPIMLPTTCPNPSAHADPVTREFHRTLTDPSASRHGPLDASGAFYEDPGAGDGAHRWPGPARESFQRAPRDQYLEKQMPRTTHPASSADSSGQSDWGRGEEKRRQNQDRLGQLGSVNHKTKRNALPSSTNVATDSSQAKPSPAKPPNNAQGQSTGQPGEDATSERGKAKPQSGCQPQTNREDSSTTPAMSSVANVGDTAGSGSTGSTAAAVISAIARPHDDTAPRERFLDVQQQNTGLNPAPAEHRNNKSPRMMSPSEPANSPAPTGIGSSAKNSEQMDIKGTLFLRKDSLEEDEEAALQLDLILSRSEDFRELLSMPEDFVTSDAEIESLQKESHQTDAFAIMNARMVDDSSKARVITAVQEVLGKANVKVYPYYYADDDRSRPSQDANDGNAQGLGDRLGQELSTSTKALLRSVSGTIYVAMQLLCTQELTILQLKGCLQLCGFLVQNFELKQKSATLYSSDSCFSDKLQQCRQTSLYTKINMHRNNPAFAEVKARMMLALNMACGRRKVNVLSSNRCPILSDQESSSRKATMAPVPSADVFGWHMSVDVPAPAMSHPLPTPVSTAHRSSVPPEQIYNAGVAASAAEAAPAMAVAAAMVAEDAGSVDAWHLSSSSFVSVTSTEGSTPLQLESHMREDEILEYTDGSMSTISSEMMDAENSFSADLPSRSAFASERVITSSRRRSRSLILQSVSSPDRRPGQSVSDSEWDSPDRAESTDWTYIRDQPQRPPLPTSPSVPYSRSTSYSMAVSSAACNHEDSFVESTYSSSSDSSVPVATEQASESDELHFNSTSRSIKAVLQKSASPCVDESRSTEMEVTTSKVATASQDHDRSGVRTTVFSSTSHVHVEVKRPTDEAGRHNVSAGDATASTAIGATSTDAGMIDETGGKAAAVASATNGVACAADANVSYTPESPTAVRGQGQQPSLSMQCTETTPTTPNGRSISRHFPGWLGLGAVRNESPLLTRGNSSTPSESAASPIRQLGRQFMSRVKSLTNNGSSTAGVERRQRSKSCDQGVALPHGSALPQGSALPYHTNNHGNHSAPMNMNNGSRALVAVADTGAQNSSTAGLA